MNNNTSPELISALKLAGYRSNTQYHAPRNERFEEKVHTLEKVFNNAGYIRTKAPGTSEYQYQYDVGGTTVMFNYRFGNIGLAAWWIK